MKNKTNTIKKLVEEGLVKNASEVISVRQSYDDYEKSYFAPYISIVTSLEMHKESWQKEIEDYCQNAAITPQDLINLHRDSLKGKKVAKNEKLRDNSNFRANLIHKKTGIE